jgi:hypothetical protein
MAAIFQRSHVAVCVQARNTTSWRTLTLSCAACCLPKDCTVDGLCMDTLPIQRHKPCSPQGTALLPKQWSLTAERCCCMAHVHNDREPCNSRESRPCIWWPRHQPCFPARVLLLFRQSPLYWLRSKPVMPVPSHERHGHSGLPLCTANEAARHAASLCWHSKHICRHAARMRQD